jgi:MFS family permease
MSDRELSNLPSRQTADEVEAGGLYSRYVVSVLTLVYVFNFLDRHILAILAQEIKNDIGLADAELGFLYGTAFAVFFVVFGIPFSRLADIWVRRKMIAIGLGFWSIMTALSGTVRGFGALSAARIGVGIGESSARPAAHSILGDYLPKRLRATALSAYSSGSCIGVGIGIILGGWVVESWHVLFPDGSAPLGLQAWQAAFLVVGLPGLAIALWVWTLREPLRSRTALGTAPDSHAHPFREFKRELCIVLPPLTVRSLIRSGVGPRALALNLGVAAILIAATWGMIAWLGNYAQWILFAIGSYAIFSWVQVLAFRDWPTFALIFRSQSIIFGLIGFSCFSFMICGLGFWIPTFIIRVHGVSTGEAGTYLGLAAAIGGLIGFKAGGIISDRRKGLTPLAGLLVGFAAMALSAPVALLMLATDSLTLALALAFLLSMTSSTWIWPVSTAVAKLVLPRMGSTCLAFCGLVVTYIGLALGPYSIGRTSDALVSTGLSSGAALGNGMSLALLSFVVAVPLFALACRFVGKDEASRNQRARADREPGEEDRMPGAAVEPNLEGLRLPPDITIGPVIGEGKRSITLRGVFHGEPVVLKVYRRQHVDKYRQRFSLNIAEFEYQRNLAFFSVDALRRFAAKPITVTGVDDSFSLCFIQELIEGITLTQLAEQMGCVPDETLRAGELIVRAAELEGLHDIDLTYDNILVRETESGWMPVIFDFNLLPQHLYPPNPVLAFAYRIGLRRKSHRDYRAIRDWSKLSELFRRNRETGSA